MKRKKLFIKAVLVCLTAAVLILLGTGSAGANTITADQMISSVTSWEGKTGYEGWCLLWVQDAWRKTGVSDGLYYGQKPASAWRYWERLVSEGRAHESKGNPTGIPVGADVFFTSDSGNGHVGIYLGDGVFMNPVATVRKTRFWGDAKSGNYYGQRYLGWAWHDKVEVISNGTLDINFNVNGQDTLNLDGIGTVEVYIDGAKWQYSGSDVYTDFCRSDIPIGKTYEVRVSLSGDWWCSGTSEGTMVGTVAANTAVRLNITDRMSERLIPDGVYLITAAGSSDKSTYFYLGADGYPAQSGVNVSLHGPLSESSVSFEQTWRVNYEHGFYTISQYAADGCLAVNGGSNVSGANVQISGGGTSGSQWAIMCSGGSGYGVAARNSGMFLDIRNGLTDTDGTNVQQWSGNGSNAQKWLFIPYRPVQEVPEGRYILLYGADPSFELDVAGDTGEIENNTNVQVWSDACPSRYNSFDLIMLDNGYYTLTHAASGMCLDLTNGSSAFGANVAVHEANGSVAQQWAILTDEDGFSLISRCSGYALEPKDDAPADGTNVQVSPRQSSERQRWILVPAEYTVSYELCGGEGTLPAQTKYYKEDLTLAAQTPSKPGYTFLGWGTGEGDTVPSYLPGETYTSDQALTLYAVWESDQHTVSFDANGGENAPDALTAEGAEAVIPSGEPTRAHHQFLGWAMDRDAKKADYQPGETCEISSDVTFYAVWRQKAEKIITLPASLTRIESGAFVRTDADAFAVPRSCTDIEEGAFENAAILGYAGSEAETYANNAGLTFVPLDDLWLPEDEVPLGLTVAAEKWTYTLTTSETMTSTEPELEGWSRIGSEWQETGQGTWEYADFPAGFDTGHALYSRYHNAGLSSEETDTAKREAGSPEHDTYLYWHWTFVDSVPDSNRNVLVERESKTGVNVGGSVYRDFICFDAFETELSLNPEGMGRNGLVSFDGMYSTYHHPEYNLAEYASWWWYRADVYRQQYTDYEKCYIYARNLEEMKESETQVVPGDGITDVRRWVKIQLP